MQNLTTLVALAAYIAGLLAWRALYPAPETALLGLAALGLLAIVAMFGSFRLSLCRRRAFLAAAIEEHSWLRHLLSGRLVVFTTSLLTGIAIVPPLAYHLLLGDRAEVLLSLALGAAVASVFLALEITSSRHVRPLYRASLFAPFVIAVASTAFVALHLVFGYNLLPLPAYLGAGEGLTDVLAAVQSEIPRHHHAVYQALSVFRVIEATGCWLLAQAGFAPAAPLTLFLIHGGLVYVSLAKLAVDLQAAFHVPTEATDP